MFVENKYVLCSHIWLRNNCAGPAFMHLYPGTHIPNGDPGMDPPAATALLVLLYFLPLDSIL